MTSNEGLTQLFSNFNNLVKANPGIQTSMNIGANGQPSYQAQGYLSTSNAATKDQFGNPMPQQPTGQVTSGNTPQLDFIKYPIDGQTH